MLFRSGVLLGGRLLGVLEVERGGRAAGHDVLDPAQVGDWGGNVGTLQ